MKKQPKKNSEEEKKENVDETVGELEEEKEKEDLDDSTEALKKKIDSLQSELKNYKDLYLRLSAEFENFKRRTSKEKLSVYDEAKSSCVSSFLEVLDNLEMALSLVQTKDKFSEGINLVVNKFYEALDKIGVVEIESLGKAFDPNYHQAIKVVEDEKYDKNIICEVFKKGFRLNDIVVRHAFVVVANP